ncbi:MAG: hypothetical protein QG553_342 [Patescibacteria group bacterium]|nr:hypothetical protein [Patescibacteria group bacterium]
MPIRIFCQAERYNDPSRPVYGLYEGPDIVVSDIAVVSMIHSQPNGRGSILEHHMRYLCPECEVIELAVLSDLKYALLKAAGMPEDTIQVAADSLLDPECQVRGPMSENDATNLKLDLSSFPTFYRSEEPGTA